MMESVLKKKLFSKMCVSAHLKEDFFIKDEEKLRKGIHRITHMNSINQIRKIKSLLHLPLEKIAELCEEDRLILTMFHFSIWGTNSNIKTLTESVERIKQCEQYFSELIEVLDYLEEHTDTVTFKYSANSPLEIHANYTRDEILVAMKNWDLNSTPDMREGVKYLRESNTDLFFVTLNKLEKQYSPTTMYLDYAVSDDLFHWQSQSTTSENSSAGQRYVNGTGTVLLFVRENKTTDGISSSYCFLGPVKHVSHYGSCPINIEWKLIHKMPARLCRMTERMSVN